MSFIFLCREIVSGKSVVRSYLNLRLRTERLRGRILDLGSGGSDRYSSFIPKEEDAVYELFDVKQGTIVDFESDTLPRKDALYDTVLLLNVLEHIYNYPHLLHEVRRIKKDNGVLIGFVPFLMWYHADPHDFFRYTDEALMRILTDAGFSHVSVDTIYSGPFVSAFQMIYTTIPRFIRLFFFVPAYVLDMLFRRLRRGVAKRYAIGYYFIAR